ncbi:MAG: hypothetical protein R3D68_18130 [Hyphomicrobiaceae bacterium]
MNFEQQIRIDPQGLFEFDSRPRAQSLARERQAPRSDADIRCRGMISWHASRRAICVKFRPALMTSPALERITGWLQSEAGPRIHLHYWAEKDWNDELHGNPRAAARRIEALARFYGAGSFSTPRRRIKAPREAARIGRHASLLAFWRERAGRFEGDGDLRLVQDLTAGRATLFHHANDGGFHMISVGNGLLSGLRNWSSARPGVSLDAYPDAGYRAQVHAVYSQVMRSGNPVFDEVDGFFAVPREPCMRRAYHRIVVPLHAGRQRFLIAATILDDDIDLRA